MEKNRQRQGEDSTGWLSSDFCFIKFVHKFLGLYGQFGQIELD